MEETEEGRLGRAYLGVDVEERRAPLDEEPHGPLKVQLQGHTQRLPQLLVALLHARVVEVHPRPYHLVVQQLQRPPDRLGRGSEGRTLLLRIRGRVLRPRQGCGHQFMILSDVHC
jgi:hypothetical protein